MNKTLDTTKISENLTPKERAKLFITLLFKSFEEIENLTHEEFKEMVPKIKKIVEACPKEQKEKFRAYLRFVLKVADILMAIDLHLEYLYKLEGRIAPLRYALGISPLIHNALKMVRYLPQLVTKEEYERGLEKARKIIRKEVLPLEGRGNLVEEEAYYRLLEEGKIKEESADLIDGWLSYIEKYGKTREELIEEAVNDAKSGLKLYLAYKRKTGEEEPSLKRYKKYQGLSDEKLKEVVAKDYASHDVDISLRITAQPTKEEYELWQRTVKEERERILKAVKEGKLKLIRQKIKRFDKATKRYKWEEKEGIELGSYYDWKERHQKYAGEGKKQGYNPFNPLAEENIDFRYVEGKGIVYLEDPSLTEEEREKWGLIAIIPPSLKTEERLIKEMKSDLISVLEPLLPIRIDKEDEDITKLRVSLPEIKIGLKHFVAKAEETIRVIQNNIALIREIERKHFGGMSLTSLNLTDPQAHIPRRLKEIEELTQRHNSHIMQIEKTFNEIGAGLWKYKLRGIEDFLINPNQKVDQKWVKKELEKTEKEVGLNG